MSFVTALVVVGYVLGVFLLCGTPVAWYRRKRSLTHLPNLKTHFSSSWEEWGLSFFWTVVLLIITAVWVGAQKSASLPWFWQDFSVGTLIAGMFRLLCYWVIYLNNPTYDDFDEIAEAADKYGKARCWLIGEGLKPQFFSGNLFWELPRGFIAKKGISVIHTRDKTQDGREFTVTTVVSAEKNDVTIEDFTHSCEELEGTYKKALASDMQENVKEHQVIAHMAGLDLSLSAAVDHAYEVVSTVTVSTPDRTYDKVSKKQPVKVTA